MKEEEEEKKEKHEKPSFPASSVSTPPPPPSWKIDFKKYICDLKVAFQEIMADEAYLKRKERLYPHVDIEKSLEKIITEFWGTRKGWECKKQIPGDVIDWRHTFDQQFSYPHNTIRKVNWSEAEIGLVNWAI